MWVRREFVKRRHFSIALAAAVAGLMSGSRTAAHESPAEKSRVPKHVCQGRNECKGQGGCAGH